jgi:hypothetical protein
MTSIEPEAIQHSAASSLRRCIATGVSLPPHQMIRFVVSPDGVVTPDIERRLPGRGMWVRAQREAIEHAVARKAFARAARRSVTVPENLADLLQHLVLARALNTLSLARRGGLAVAGLERVKKFTVGLMLLARDAGRDARNKVHGLADGAPILAAFDAVELGSAFGRDQAVFVAVARGKLAEMLTSEAERLEGLRATPAAPQDAN